MYYEITKIDNKKKHRIRIYRFTWKTLKEKIIGKEKENPLYQKIGIRRRIVNG